MIERKIIWSEAGLPGLVLGILCIAYFAVTSLLQLPLLTAILWVAKLFGCIFIMYLFIKKFVSIHPEEASNSDSFRFGVAVSVLSAFIYSAGYFIFLQYICPDFLSDAMNSAMQAYGSMLDSNSTEMIENMMPKLPTIGFFTNFLWCAFYGAIVSAVISRSVPSENPFKEDGK